MTHTNGGGVAIYESLTMMIAKVRTEQICIYFDGDVDDQGKQIVYAINSVPAKFKFAYSLKMSVENSIWKWERPEIVGNGDPSNFRGHLLMPVEHGDIMMHIRYSVSPNLNIGFRYSPHIALSPGAESHAKIYSVESISKNGVTQQLGPAFSKAPANTSEPTPDFLGGTRLGFKALIPASIMVNEKDE